jgi:ferric-dicitrate binding protein FerR (iron transport regulator)
MQQRLSNGAVSRRIRIARLRLLGIVAAVALWLPTAAFAQAGGCALVADERNPPQRILRCGDGLAVRTAPGANYHPVNPQGKQPPTALQVDAGAVEVEFHPGDGHRNFQILTPFAIAAVRGTKWIVDVTPTRTSTFVIAGTVAVRRPDVNELVYLDPGEGVDVAAGSNPLIVRRWPQARVRALLARFGE